MEVKRKRLNPGSSKPLYKQLAEILRDQISCFPKDTKFHSEKQLCEKFKVSQPVVRMALAILEEEGLIVRVSTKGTYTRGKAKGFSGEEKIKLGIISPLKTTKHIHAIKGINEFASANNSQIVLFENEDPMDTGIPRMVSLLKKHKDKASGFIWISGIMVDAPPLPMEFNREPHRHVFINLLVPGGRYTCLIADHRNAIRLLVNKIIARGHTSIGYIGGPEERLSARMRYEGFAAAMEENRLGMDPASVVPYSGGYDFYAGYNSAKKFVDNGNLPEIIVATTDEMANGAITLLKEKNLRVPEDVGITGFDNDEIAVQMRPQLTTVGAPYYEQGTAAASQLYSQLEGKNRPGSISFLPCEIIERESCLGARLANSGLISSEQPSGAVSKF